MRFGVRGGSVEPIQSPLGAVWMYPLCGNARGGPAVFGDHPGEGEAAVHLEVSLLDRTPIRRDMSSPKRLARIAGVLYLIVGIFGGFAVGYANPSVYVPGEAATTAANVAANPGLVRAAVLADLLQATALLFLAMVLYVLLKDVNRNAARAMVIIVAIATTIMCLNEVFQFSALLVAGDASYVAAFGAAGSDALVMLLMDMFHYGFLIAQIFFGLWLIPLGYLAYKSALFPKALGIVLVVGGVSYLVDLVVAFVLPDLSKQIHGFLAIPPAIAEIGMVGYLLWIGLRPSPRTDPDPDAA